MILKTTEDQQRQRESQKKKIILGGKSYSDVVSSKIYNTNNIVVFSESIGNFNCDMRSSFTKELKNGRTRYIK